MQQKLRMGFGVIVVALGSTACATADEHCPPPQGVALQVLGSGGPIADDGRASAGYLVWVDGVSRVLIDAGGGTFLRFAEAGADFAELDFVGLSHFHADHSADIAALLKSGNFSGRKRPLAVAGPAGSGPFPGLDDFLASMLARDGGAYGYLSGYLDGSRGLARLDAVEIAADIEAPMTVFSDDQTALHIQALPVPHGIVPALGFRVSAAGFVIVFASDQNGSNPQFVGFARDADILVMHLPIPETATGTAVALHARPSRIAEIASTAGAESLLLSHFMARSLRDLDANVAIVRQGYERDVALADDLMCLKLAR